MVKLSNFRAKDYPVMTDRGALPAGAYVVEIVASEMKHTKAGNGQYLSLEFQVTEGDRQGRKCWTNLNLINPNETAVNIARSELATICIACGMDVPGDSERLHGIPMRVIVDTKEYGEGKVKNVIVNYLPIESGQTQPAPTTAPAKDEVPF